MNSAVAVSPCAAAIWYTTRTAESRTRARDSGENERMVTCSLASSGMTLFVVPAWKLPTVMTTGSKMSKRRGTSTCSGVTISQGTGMGAAAGCGWGAGPPRAGGGGCQGGGGGLPRPPPGAEHAEGQSGRRDVQRVGGGRPLAGRVEHSLLDHVPGAAVPLLTRLEHEHHAARQFRPARGQQPRRTDEHRRMQVMPAGV